MIRTILAAAAATLLGVAGQASAQTVQQDRSFTDASGFRAVETPGGYAPAAPAIDGPVTPATKVDFVPQTLTPSEAFPPPAPRKTYPPCSKQRRDECLQRK
ncbi:hypothetical protein CA233_01720 [Sphingomonas sp. ABOLD]|uniref:Uncharacterized protein n=1 Tax=Sphingomonas trueperi TaxID=53317 RepID=A0A7X6BFH5_9SPHN|nr:MULTISPECIES: hypothetical protein [Sphingomonas]NJB99842.1 hypothetical protein [Sphingomonas trueperi]RSV52422.1 hypothetical protein CA233_01720 [Sphingomonas sp. ABOLD]